MEMIQSFFLVRSFSVLTPSILNLNFATKRFSGFKFTTGLCDPSFLETRKMRLVNWSGRGFTSVTAAFCSSSWTFSDISLFSSPLNLIGLGGLSCRGTAISSREFPFTTCQTPGSKVIRFQFSRQNLSLPASGRLPNSGMDTRLTLKIEVCRVANGAGQLTGQKVGLGNLFSLELFLSC